MPDDPPRQFRWRQHAHRVVKVEGPERITNEWWRARPPTSKLGDTQVAALSAPPVRDYFRVEDDDGGRFWLFRDGPLNAGGNAAANDGGAIKWYLHGFCA